MIHCRKENSNRLSIFSKGSAILQDWIKQSNEELSQTAERKNKIADEIAALEKQIEAEEATLNEIKAKVAESARHPPQKPVKRKKEPLKRLKGEMSKKF